MPVPSVNLNTLTKIATGRVTATICDGIIRRTSILSAASIEEHVRREVAVLVYDDSKTPYKDERVHKLVLTEKGQQWFRLK